MQRTLRAPRFACALVPLMPNPLGEPTTQRPRDAVDHRPHRNRPDRGQHLARARRRLPIDRQRLRPLIDRLGSRSTIHAAQRSPGSSRARINDERPKRTDARFRHPVSNPANNGLVTDHPAIPARSPARLDRPFRNAVPEIRYGTLTAPNQGMQRTLRAPRFACALVPLMPNPLGDHNPKTERRRWVPSAQRSTGARPTSRNGTPPALNRPAAAAPTH